jgi:outer membrane cobalamin receptor
MKSRRYVLAALAALPAAAHAQDAPASGEVIVTATRLPALADRQPFSVTTIGAAELRASESVADALADVPEVYVQMPGGRSGFASLFLRGADPNFTTVLLEGVPLDSPTNSRGGAVNLASVPTAAIDRVELVAGPASTLYGSGPLAGALNLLLPEPTETPRLTAGGTLGTEGEYSAFGRWQGPLALGWGGSLTAVLDDAGTGQPQSRFRSRSADARLAPLGGEEGHVLLHWAETRSRGFPDSSGGYDHAAIREPERRKSDELMVAAEQGIARAGPATFTLAGSYFTRGDEVTSPGVAPSAFSPSGVPAGSDTIRYRHGIVRPTVNLALDAWQLTLGAQGQWETARSEGYLDFGVPIPAGYRDDRTTWSAFAELNGSLGQLELNEALRIDSIERIGTRVTGRAGLRYFLGRDVSLHASAGTAFKAPSFYALGNPFIGNPDLKPESSTAFELGFDWRMDSANRASVVLFRTRYRNLVDFIPADPPRLANRSHVTSQGVAASFSRAIGESWQFGLQAQYAETQDGVTGTQLLNRPRWRAGASLEWRPLEELRLGARYAFTDERDDYAIPTGTLTLKPTHRARLSAVWTLDPGTQLRLDAENLLDDRGEDAIGFPGPGRRVRIGFTSTLR